MPASIPIPYLEEFRDRLLAGERPDVVSENTLLGGLRLNNRETYAYLYAERPSCEEFERWILAKNGGALDRARVERINAAIAGAPEPGVLTDEPVLSPADLAFWDEQGYVVLHDAAGPEQCAAAAAAIYAHLGMDPADADSWYGEALGHTIWVPLLHHPAMWAVRDAPRIHRAFAQVWGRSDLWVTVDQVGMNPPERPGWLFPGPHLHWDVSLARPVPFGTQGILYLTDTAAEQGAFRCVPGFHHRLDEWLRGLPEGADPRQQDLEALGAVPIPGRAGDLILWHHALPHGASPNRGTRPRLVQYLNERPSRWLAHAEWL